MLSVLIPIYNFDVRQMVKDLQEQAMDAVVPIEILCLDDCSADEFKALHQPMNEWDKVRYEELPKNVGRAAIRNRLAEMAAYDYLLFLDGDGGILSTRFLANYIQHLAPNVLLYGGREYASVPPKNQDLLLHWTFGSIREVKSVEERKKMPWSHFMTNNFVVPRSIQLAIPFDENITQYGHEDTLFGLELKSRAIPILHLDNRVEHIGLEPASHFLGKVRESIENIYLLKEYPDFTTRLLEAYNRLIRYGLSRFFYYVLSPFIPLLIWQLKGSSPHMKVLDIYKLWYLCGVNNGK